MSVRGGITCLGLAAGLLLACDGNGNPELDGPPSEADSGGGAGGKSSSDGGGGTGAALTDSGDEFVLPEASNVVVRVGIEPVPRASGDGGVSASDETLAHLDVIAAGARAATIVRRWDRLFTDTGQPNEDEWQYLAALSKLYADAGRPLLLSLAVVDRGADARPASVTGAWDGAATQTAVHSLIDRTLSTFGTELAYLSLGTEVDRFLEGVSAVERASFVAFAGNALDYARSHPSLPSGIGLGVTLSYEGALDASASTFALLSASDVAVVNYHALASDFSARPASAAAGDLDALHAAIGGQQIVLQAVAYPSAAEVGSTLAQQRTFFDSFFVALLSRREHFPFVVVRGLNDADAQSCEADAAALGAAGDIAAIAAHCSFGLRSSSGDDKPAWASVIDGLATFSSP